MPVILIICVILIVFGCWGTNASPAAKITASSEGNSLQVFGLFVVLGLIALILMMSLGVK